MDIVAISAEAVAIALPFLGKVSDGAAEKLGEKAVEAGSGMLGWLRSRTRGDAAVALTELEATPDDASKRAALEAALVRQLEAAPSEAAEMLAFLQKNESYGVSIDNREGVYVTGQATNVFGAKARNISIGARE